MVKKYVDVEIVNRRIEKLCREHDLPFGGERGSLGRDLVKFADSLPTVDLPFLPGNKQYDTDKFPSDNHISNPSQQTRLKVIWEKSPVYRNCFVWVCRYGNIITRSTVSPERCFKMHIKKLKSNGIDISKFDDKPIIIQKSEVI